MEDVRFAGAGGDELDGRLWVPSSAETVPAVVLVPGLPGQLAALNAPAQRLSQAGFAVLALDPFSRADGAELADRRVNADLEGALAYLVALEAVDGERIAAVGFGTGGTWAYLLGCCSRTLAAAVSFGGPLVYPELSANRPAQPLEMVLNLSVPFLAFHGGADESVPLEHVERLRAACSQFSRDCDIVVHPEAGHGFHDPEEEAYDAALAESAWKHTATFLRDHLELA